MSYNTPPIKSMLILRITIFFCCCEFQTLKRFASIYFFVLGINPSHCSSYTLDGKSYFLVSSVILGRTFSFPGNS